MKLGRCPVCHASLHLDALMQDEAGSELLALFAGLDAELGRALIAYLGLFRPEKSDLSLARTLRLAREVLTLADADRLAWALAETVEGLRAKGTVRRLGNHNYLRRVLDSAAQSGRSIVRVEAGAQPAGGRPLPADSRISRALSGVLNGVLPEVGRDDR